eukprot:m.510692 g.510692  ORF g.510692 m.510692 type:complete len:122 (+) comp57419_c0_seq14:993-1358(+)
MRTRWCLASSSSPTRSVSRVIVFLQFASHIAGPMVLLRFLEFPPFPPPRLLCLHQFSPLYFVGYAVIGFGLVAFYLVDARESRQAAKMEAEQETVLPSPVEPSRPAVQEDSPDERVPLMHE